MNKCASDNNVLSGYKCMEALGCEFLHPGGRYATKRAVDKLKISSNDKIVEIGCGTGNTAAVIHALTGAVIVGIDIDGEMIEKARKTASGNSQKLEFLTGSGDDIPFEDSSFDALISEGTTFFMDAEKALKGYCRVLKPGGRIGLVEISYFKQPSMELERLTSEVTCCYGMQPLLFDEWEEKIKRAGFDIVNIDRKSMNMGMGAMIQCKGFQNSMKMFANMIMKPHIAKRMMQIMKHYKNTTTTSDMEFI